jgi:hypothetical protein
MPDVFKYLANAQDCLCNAAGAANAQARQSWLDLAESWLGMVPQDLRTLAEMLEEAPDQSAEQKPSKMLH